MTFVRTGTEFPARSIYVAIYGGLGLCSSYITMTSRMQNSCALRGNYTRHIAFSSVYSVVRCQYQTTPGANTLSYTKLYRIFTGSTSISEYFIITGELPCENAASA
jgi:hypothetical protein